MSLPKCLRATPHFCRAQSRRIDQCEFVTLTLANDWIFCLPIRRARHVCSARPGTNPPAARSLVAWSRSVPLSLRAFVPPSLVAFLPSCPPVLFSVTFVTWDPIHFPDNLRSIEHLQLLSSRRRVLRPAFRPQNVTRRITPENFHIHLPTKYLRERRSQSCLWGTLVPRNMTWIGPLAQITGSSRTAKLGQCSRRSPRRIVCRKIKNFIRRAEPRPRKPPASRAGWLTLGRSELTPAYAIDNYLPRSAFQLLRGGRGARPFP